MDLQQLITQQLKDSVLDKVSKVSGADSDTASIIAQQMVPVFLENLKSNAKDSVEAGKIEQAIDQDHSGSTLEDVVGSIGNDSSVLDGSKILGHVFGDKLGKVQGEISQKTGAQNDVTSTVMSVLAPVILGNIGKVKSEQGMDITTVLDYFNSGKSSKKKSGINSVLTDLVDQNNDGNVVDDIVRFGSKFLNKK
ncbi:DUF937 domain-containing protein [Candidatus Saccharibacteria bacterium]|nr:DUF937 domain-containing protein [Candidatus Saccharibacteria bacterium]